RGMPRAQPQELAAAEPAHADDADLHAGMLLNPEPEPRASIMEVYLSVLCHETRQGFSRGGAAGSGARFPAGREADPASRFLPQPRADRASDFRRRQVPRVGRAVRAAPQTLRADARRWRAGG